MISSERVKATKDAPSYLSRQQTTDAIDTIARATGRNKRLCKAMVAVVMPDGTAPKCDDTKQEAAFLEDATNFILCLDCE